MIKSSFKASLPPCALQLHPNNRNVIVLGTYKYEPETRVKSGSVEIYLRDVDSGNIISVSKTPLDFAILDLQFSANEFNGKLSNKFITAQSNGKISLWKLEMEDHFPEIISEFEIFDSDETITSTRFSQTFPNLVTITSTTGKVAVFDLFLAKIVNQYHPHSLEAWIGEFGNFELSNVVYSGGDDCLFTAFDIRSDCPVFSSNRVHSAGVTSILTANSNWNYSNSKYIFTGGYDDHLKLSDLRMMPKIIEKEDHNLDGGVWRLVPFYNNPDKIIVSCMYEGVKIVDSSTGKIVGSFKGDHDSMVYGAEVVDENTAISCSFYDEIVQLWDVNQAATQTI